MNGFERLFPIAAICLPLTLAACGGDTDEALVGTFAECDGGGDQFVFGADGSYQFEENGEVENGTYTADGRTLVILGEVDGAPFDIEVGYYVNDTHFVFGAGYPDGDNDGVVGTWNTHLRIDDDGDVSGVATTMVLAADNTGSILQVPYDGSEVYERDGTWRPDPDDNNQGGYELVIEEAENLTLRLSFQLIDEAVIGTPDYCRVGAN